MNGRTIRYFLPALFWATAIAVVSSIPNLGAPLVVGLTLSDKLAHFTEYFIFGAALAFGFHRSGTTRPIFLAAIFVGILFGASDEIHQYFVPGRSSELWDLVADAIGSTAGAGAYIGLKEKLLKIIPWGAPASRDSQASPIENAK